MQKVLSAKELKSGKKVTEYFRTIDIQLELVERFGKYEVRVVKQRENLTLKNLPFKKYSEARSSFISLRKSFKSQDMKKNPAQYRGVLIGSILKGGRIKTFQSPLYATKESAEKFVEGMRKASKKSGGKIVRSSVVAELAKNPGRKYHQRKAKEATKRQIHNIKKGYKSLALYEGGKIVAHKESERDFKRMGMNPNEKKYEVYFDIVPKKGKPFKSVVTVVGEPIYVGQFRQQRLQQYREKGIKVTKSGMKLLENPRKKNMPRRSKPKSSRQASKSLRGKRASFVSKKSKWYVGIGKKSKDAQVFTSHVLPSRGSHGKKFSKVVGPFKSYMVAEKYWSKIMKSS